MPPPRRSPSPLRRNRGAIVRRVQAASDILLSRPDIDGRMAAVGYCLGGMIVLEYARSGSTISGVVSVHGSLETTSPAEPSSIRARILVCHGALDPYVPMSQVEAFAEEMKNAGADYQLIVYGNAMHRFTHETATGTAAGRAVSRANRRALIGRDSGSFRRALSLMRRNVRMACRTEAHASALQA